MRSRQRVFSLLASAHRSHFRSSRRFGCRYRQPGTYGTLSLPPAHPTQISLQVGVYSPHHAYFEAFILRSIRKEREVTCRKSLDEHRCPLFFGVLPLLASYLRAVLQRHEDRQELQQHLLLTEIADHWLDSLLACALCKLDRLMPGASCFVFCLQLTLPISNAVSHTLGPRRKTCRVGM